MYSPNIYNSQVTYISHIDDNKVSELKGTA